MFSKDDAPFKVGFAFLHTPLFLGGKNLSDKLDGHMRKELHMVYDKQEMELVVTWNNKTARIPSTNVAYYIPGEPEDRKIEGVSHPMVAGSSASAQVETPMSHVHAGPGAGKTGQKAKK